MYNYFFVFLLVVSENVVLSESPSTNLLNLFYIFLGYTSLIWASRKGHLDIVTELLKNGADINAKSSVGKLFYIIYVLSNLKYHCCYYLSTSSLG